MESLSRTELQGVAAHEFSHILNGDMRLNMRVTGLLQGTLSDQPAGAGADAGPWAQGRRRRFAGLGSLSPVGGFLFGSLIKAGISRQREFLADPSAVKFTRDPRESPGR
ncbi:MAG: hypothetical protein Ct9H300mP16_02690 [Pseudomonadota bacterium]|nr:MAG: hypothetical protein Ct9H300mP16_02690 [Pseudomonadota bacterium]